MSEGLNRAMLIGNLGADPEVRHTPSGQAVCSLRLATSESYVDRDKQRQTRTEWHRVTVWGPRGEALGRLLRKGETIYVEGRIETRSWEKDGEKRYSTEVVATDVKLLGGKREGGAQHRETRHESAPADDGFGEDGIPF